ncbi:MAG TPA: hypothetical protein VHU87_15605 [Rhizomicrobium sp.]|jgi:hypothetical protein|nr:hypothetical protein [Rhizomicrobium sp.]
MKRHAKLILACSALSLAPGCAKPDSVRVVKSPDPSVILTIETYKGLGPVSADEVGIYAHFTQGGATSQEQILGGENLTISKLSWQKPNELTICLSGGITDMFRNEVALILGRSDRTVHSVLREDC